MPRLEITGGELVAFHPIAQRGLPFESWQMIWRFELAFWVKRRLMAAGFDLTKPITRHEKDYNDSIVFHQEESPAHVA